jgi:hypothetical protein
LRIAGCELRDRPILREKSAGETGGFQKRLLRQLKQGEKKDVEQRVAR